VVRNISAKGRAPILAVMVLRGGEARCGGLPFIWTCSRLNLVTFRARLKSQPALKWKTVLITKKIALRIPGFDWVGWDCL